MKLSLDLSFRRGPALVLWCTVLVTSAGAGTGAKQGTPRHSTEDPPAGARHQDGREVHAYDPSDSVRADPTSPEARVELGRWCALQGKPEEAIAAFKVAIELKADYEEAYIELANVYIGLGRSNEAVRVFRLGLQSLPNSLGLLTALHESLSGMRQFADAADVAKQIVARQPTEDSYNLLGWDYLKLERYDDAISNFRQAVAINPDYARGYHNLGWAFMRLKRYEDALEAYGNIPKDSADYDKMAGVYREIGLAYIRLERYADAIAVLGKAIEIDPSFMPAYCGLCEAYGRSGQYDEAMTVARKALARTPEEGCALINLGNAFVALGRYDEAESAYRRAIRDGREPAYAYAALANGFWVQGKFVEAEDVLERAVALQPKLVDWRLQLGSLRARRGDAQAAEKEYAEALILEPGNARALNNLGYSLVERGVRLAEALTMIEKAVQVDASNGSYRDSLGWAYFKLGQLDKAEAALLEAASLSPHSATVREHLGDVNAKRGDLTQAAEWWNKALLDASSDEERARIRAKLAIGPKVP